MALQDKIPVLLANKTQELVEFVVPAIVNLAFQIGMEKLDEVTGGIILPELCIPDAELKKVLDIRNNIVSKVNSASQAIEALKKPLNTLNTTVNVSSKALQTINIAITAAEIAIPLLPTSVPGTPNPAGIALTALTKIKDFKLPITDKINIAKWFESKFPSSEIFLEEVPRENVKLQELWEHSPHTQDLKKLYLKNPKIINALDIRPFMIPVSWEVVNIMNKNEYNIKLKVYLLGINNFFKLADTYLLARLKNYSQIKLENTKLGSHFLKIKKKLFNFLNENYSVLDWYIYDINQNHTNIMEGINDILNDIMEWYICAKIELKKPRPIIIHAGLFHTDNVIKWLSSHYNYNIIKDEGINSMEESETATSINGCVNIGNINSLF